MNQSFVSTLESNKSSMTKERLCIFDILEKTGHALTINELVTIASKHTINRSTVYRTIDLFEKLNIVNRVYTGWKYKIELSDTYSSHHHHMTCENCGAVISIHDPHGLEGLIQTIERNHNIQVTRHAIELQGLCGKCRKRNTP